MEVMLTQVGYRSLPPETLLAHSSLYTVLILGASWNTDEKRVEYLLSLPYNEKTMSEVLKTPGLKGDEARARLVRAAVSLQDEAWNRFRKALAEAALEDQFFEPLLNAAHSVAGRRSRGLLSERDFWMTLTNPAHRRTQKLYQQILGLDAEGRHIETVKQHALRSRIFLDHALHVFSAEEALTLLQVYEGPSPSGRSHEEKCFPSRRHLRLSLLLLYGRLPDLLVRKVASTALQLTCCFPSSLRPELQAEKPLIVNLAELTNLLLSWFQLKIDEEEIRWCRTAWSGLFAIQAAMQSDEEPPVKRPKLMT
ncbi:hypothetical protein EBZ37_11850 [bacterium]|nr:hypothetical protein [bacterium]